MINQHPGDRAKCRVYAMRDEPCSVDAIDVVAKPAQLTHEIGSLVDECLRTAVEQFDSAAKVLKARRRRGRIVIGLARMLEIDAHQFKHSNHRIAVRDMMLALPLADCACQWIISAHAANLSAARTSIRSRSAAR